LNLSSLFNIFANYVSKLIRGDTSTGFEINNQPFLTGNISGIAGIRSTPWMEVPLLIKEPVESR